MNFPSFKNLSSTRYLVHRALNRFMGKQVQGHKFGVVVDIGAGKSPYKKFIEAEKYLCLDVENRVGDSSIIIADLNERVPLEDNYADCVICTEVLEHIKKPQNAMNEIYRILKPKGKLILTTPMVWPHHEVPHDFYRYSKFGLEHLLTEAGFTDVKIRPSNNYTYTIAQLSVAYLRNPVFKPLVAVINAIGLVSQKFGTNFDMPLGHQVTASK